MRVSVIILTYNRKEDVLFVLKGYSGQTHPDIEYIIVDNASTDGTREAVLREFPFVNYISMPENFDLRSYIAGVRAATGSLIWRCDSDSLPGSDNDFADMVRIMELHPEISIIAMENIEMRSGGLPSAWYPLPVDTANPPECGYQCHSFTGSGAMIRREVFEEIGGFWGFGFEEYDFSIRAISAGFLIRYFPQFQALHYASERARNRLRNHALISNQYMRLVWKHFPTASAIRNSIAIYFFQLLQIPLRRMPIAFFFEMALSMPAVALSTIRSERSPVSKQKLYDITLGFPISKYLRHYFFSAIKMKFKRDGK